MPVLLKGTLPALISSPALVVGSYVAGALLLIGALGVVAIPNLRRALQAFAFTLLAAAFIFLVLDALPLLLVQLVAAAAVIGLVLLVARWPAIDQPPLGLLGWSTVPAGLASAGLLLLLAGTAVRSTWRFPFQDIPEALADALATRYLVPTGALVVLVASVAMGVFMVNARRESGGAAPVTPQAPADRRRRPPGRRS